MNLSGATLYTDLTKSRPFNMRLKSAGQPQSSIPARYRHSASIAGMSGQIFQRQVLHDTGANAWLGKENVIPWSTGIK